VSRRDPIKLERGEAVNGRREVVKSKDNVLLGNYPPTLALTFYVYIGISGQNIRPILGMRKKPVDYAHCLSENLSIGHTFSL
jgi:hypothetical protein